MKWLQWIYALELKERKENKRWWRRKCEEEKIVWSVEAFIIALLSDDYDDGVSYR